MEQLKHSVRPYNAKQQHVQSMTKGPTYYRVSVDSAFSDNASITDTTFKMDRSLPNRRADLLNGDWEAFLESFTGTLPSLDGHVISVKVCLPDLIASSHDNRTEFEAPATYRVHNDNTVGIVPLPHQYAAPGHANEPLCLQTHTSCSHSRIPEQSGSTTSAAKSTPTCSSLGSCVWCSVMSMTIH